MVLQHAHLLGDDVHLLADLGADLHQRVAVVRADALGLRQLVANDVTRQSGVQRLASALLALVASDQCRVFTIDFGRPCLRGRRERLSLVEEQVLLVGATGLALANNWRCNARRRSSARSRSVVAIRSAPASASRSAMSAASSSAVMVASDDTSAWIGRPCQSFLQPTLA